MNARELREHLIVVARRLQDAPISDTRINTSVEREELLEALAGPSKITLGDTRPHVTVLSREETLEGVAVRLFFSRATTLADVRAEMEFRVAQFQPAAQVSP